MKSAMVHKIKPITVKLPYIVMFVKKRTAEVVG